MCCLNVPVIESNAATNDDPCNTNDSIKWDSKYENVFYENMKTIYIKEILNKYNMLIAVNDVDQSIICLENACCCF